MHGGVGYAETTAKSIKGVHRQLSDTFDANSMDVKCDDDEESRQAISIIKSGKDTWRICMICERTVLWHAARAEQYRGNACRLARQELREQLHRPGWRRGS